MADRYIIKLTRSTSPDRGARADEPGSSTSRRNCHAIIVFRHHLDVNRRVGLEEVACLRRGKRTRQWSGEGDVPMHNVVPEHRERTAIVWT